VTEEQLVKALNRGELSALEALMDRYGPYVSSVAARILRGRASDAEELTADVFLAAWDNRDKLRPGQVKGYLGAIARNRAFNLLRSNRESLPLDSKNTVYRAAKFFLEDQGGFSGVDDTTGFYINAAGNPVIVFPKYAIAIGAMGAVEFEISP